jgi:tRNA nucleotidyltransferase (CCA-adding enzyme)
MKTYLDTGLINRMREIVTLLHKLFPDELHDRIFLVGGTVRDMLLGKKNQDIDLVASLSHDELLALGFRLVEARSSATIYFKHHQTFGKIEVTRINNRDELGDDLLQRDFTINAMAMTLAGVQIDPVGGEADLKAGLLRACSNLSFTGDPLRIFRTFRFAADGWRMTPETESLIRNRDWSDAFSVMPVERFSNEMLKALAMKKPEHFFEQMIKFKGGAEFLPELFQMPNIPAGPLEHHPEGDLLTHSVQVLQRVATASADPLARFCAFFHDLGKLFTDPALYPRHHGHDDAGFEMAADFCNRLCLPATYRKALACVSRLHGKANKWDELRNSTKVRMAEQAIKAGIVEILPLVSAADKPGNQLIAGWKDAVRVAAMNTRELGIDQEKLEAMPIENRPSFILQKRIDVLRND